MPYTDMKMHEINEMMKEMSKKYPRLQQGFSKFMMTTMQEGKVDIKTKELIALAVGIVTGCEWCIVYHAKKALECGLTKEEIIEASYVTVLMAGAPALMHFVPLVTALEEFSE